MDKEAFNRNIKIIWRQNNVSHSRKQNGITLSVYSLAVIKLILLEGGSSNQMLLTGILTSERIICKGEALSRIKQADSSQSCILAKLSPAENQAVLSTAYFFFILAIFPPWIFNAPLLCEPTYALPTNPFAAQVNKCWVLLFAANPDTVCPSDIVIQ